MLHSVFLSLFLFIYVIYFNIIYFYIFIYFVCLFYNVSSYIGVIYMDKRNYDSGLMSNHLHISRAQLCPYDHYLPTLNKQHISTSTGATS